MAASVTNRNGGKEKNKMRVRGPTACPPPTNRFVPKARTKYKKSKSAVADGKALLLARTQLGHKVSLLIVYAERIIIISHHTKFELANLKR